MAEKPPARAAAPGRDMTPVIVEVHHAVAFGGMMISPKTDPQKGINHDQPQLAVVPKWLADAHPDSRLKYVKDAPPGARFGPIE